LELERPKRFELSTFSLGSCPEGSETSKDIGGQSGANKDEQVISDDGESSTCDEHEDT